MTRFRDAPQMPRETCPEINAAIDVIDTAINKLGDLTGPRGELEGLRTQNEKLRECATYWEEQAGALVEEIAKLEAKIEDLESTHVVSDNGYCGRQGGGLGHVRGPCICTTDEQRQNCVSWMTRS